MAINNTERNIILHKDKFWNYYQRALIPVLPPHINKEVGKAECKELINLYKPYFIRWTSQWDCRRKTGFWFMIKDSKEDLSEYSSKMRNSINRGNRHFHAKIINKTTLRSEGYELYIKALNRYQIKQSPYSEKEFQAQLDQLFTIGEWEFWGVYSNDSGKLAGYSMNWIYDKSCEYKTIKLDPAFLKDYSGYLLIHEMNKFYLNEKGFRYVNDGSRSLLHESNIQEFLEKKFLFRKAFCELNIRYSPVVSIAVKGLYPWRALFYSAQNSTFRKISTLLKHEEIIRNKTESS